MMLLFHQEEVWQQRGCRLALPRCLTGGRQVLQHITLLRAQSEHDRQHPGDELATERRLRAETGPPPDPRRPQGALGRVIRRLDTCHTHKQPEGWLDFEQLATRPRGSRPGRLIPARRFISHTPYEPLLNLSRESRHPLPPSLRGSRCHREHEATTPTICELGRAIPRRSFAILRRVRRSFEIRRSEAPNTIAAAPAAT